MVTPIIRDKNCDPYNLKNYRPVSSFSFLSQTLLYIIFKLLVFKFISLIKFSLKLLKVPVWKVLTRKAVNGLYKLNNDILNLLSCRGSIFFRNCDGCSCAVSCQQFRTRDCDDFNIYLLCTTQPVIEASVCLIVIIQCLIVPWVNFDHFFVTRFF